VLNTVQRTLDGDFVYIETLERRRTLYDWSNSFLTQAGKVDRRAADTCLRLIVIA